MYGIQDPCICKIKLKIYYTIILSPFIYLFIYLFIKVKKNHVFERFYRKLMGIQKQKLNICVSLNHVINIKKNKETSVNT
jgi:hypothetical protein